MQRIRWHNNMLKLFNRIAKRGERVLQGCASFKAFQEKKIGSFLSPLQEKIKFIEAFITGSLLM